MSAVCDKFGAASAKFAELHRIQPRFLICIGGMDLMFNEKGQPKNAEIKVILKRLLGPAFAPFPFDLVMLGSEDSLGAPLSNAPDPCNPIHYRIRLDRLGLDEQAEEHIQTRLHEGRVKIDLGAQDPATVGKLLSGYTIASQNASTFSPPKDNVPLPLKRSHVNFLHFARRPNVMGVLVDNFPVLAIGLTLEGENDPQAPHNDFNEAVISGLEAQRSKMDQLWNKLDRRPDSTSIAEAQNTLRLDVENKAALKSRLSPPNDPLRSFWRDVHRRLGASRFSLTILMAAANHLVIHAAKPTDGAFA